MNSVGQDQPSIPTAPARRALVVDDHFAYRALAAALLEKRGFAVEGAEDASNALVCLEQGSFDLLLVDLHMPGMAGNDLCRMIRRDIGLCRIPIIAYTADGLAGAQLAKERGGFDGVLVKPLSALSLDSILSRCFPPAEVL